ncbi:iron chelate uptake ABC transporter family permease subunit [Nocardioides hwasunensis]|uniref:Iron ABC transporter permease n=1 Tax=Nocardioides hwasunensis TaxID=397258 RepID=A0ABR8MFJ7_9ACTN|nr:iron ABC transporter permease [Nocardioides hwasunensis]MBD3914840.1 iron ABC transporter permease [Nocardioides hwasunensis]
MYRSLVVAAGAAALLAAALLTSLAVGAATLSPPELLLALTDPQHPVHVSALHVRLPRALLGAVAGAGLAAAGVLLQDALGNPVAGPELLGVSSGAAVVAATATVLHLPVPLQVLPLLSLAGALAAGLVVVLAVGPGSGPGASTRVVLVGAAVTAACGGVVVAVIGLGTEGDVVLLMRYLLGSLSARGWNDLAVVALGVVPALLAALLLTRSVAALRLGDHVATGLGVSVARVRLMALLVASLAAATVAAICGPVAYVALLAPHVARAAAGTTSTPLVLLVAAPVGSTLLVVADLASRTAFYPVEVPVGIATTLVGVPLLALLTLRGRPA